MSKSYIELPENSRLYYQTYGSVEHNLILLHGLVGGSFLGEEWAGRIRESNVRCIVPERTGYGESSPVKFNAVNDWIPIIQILAGQLGITSADVIGCSAGAPYAYATALALPHIIGKVYILGGVPAVFEEKVLRHYSRQNQEAYGNFAGSPINSIQEYYIPQMEAALERVAAARLTYLEATLEEILKQRCYGMAQESKLQILPWKLPLSKILQPVTLYHAVSDEMVPYDAAREMPAFLANSAFIEADTKDLPEGESRHMGSITQSLYQVLRNYNN